MIKRLATILLLLVMFFIPIEARAEEEVIIPDEIVSYCDFWGEQYGICSELLQSICWQESRCTPDARSGNCKGMCQINEKIFHKKIEALGITDLYDPYQNIQLCASIIYDLSQKNDDLFYVLQAYNGGNNGIILYNKGIYTSYAKSVTQRSSLLEERKE